MEREARKGAHLASPASGFQRTTPGGPRKDSRCSTANLRRELEGFTLTTSRFFSNFSLDRLLAEATHCQMVKHRAIRQVFYLKAPVGEFFLKRNTLVRTKDRLRHLFLPRRRWAEWRNLHRLRTARVAAADPVLRGENGGNQPESFFVVTRKVNGIPLKCDSLAGAKGLGKYIAFLHAKGIYHADFHPENIIIKDNGQACLIDAQEVFFLPWLPRWLRLRNLGKFCFHQRFQLHPGSWMTAFLGG